MNQILVINDEYNYKDIKYKKNKNYLILFFISISIGTSLLIYCLYSYLIRLNESKIASMLKNQFNISTLYSPSNTISSIKLNNNIDVIGSIDIPKINISYPIIDNTNYTLLKTSVCRFAGPLPNRIGNLCIAGHNYKNNLMFSNLYKLNIGDSIYITDLNNTRLEYVIYDKFKVHENNLACTQNSNKVEITLITCNSSNNSQRIIIKAKMKG